MTSAIKLTYDQEEQVVRQAIRSSIMDCLVEDHDEGGYPIELDREMVVSLVNVLQFFSSAEYFRDFLGTLNDEERAFISPLWVGAEGRDS